MNKILQQIERYYYIECVLIHSLIQEFLQRLFKSKTTRRRSRHSQKEQFKDDDRLCRKASQIGGATQEGGHSKTMGHMRVVRANGIDRTPPS